MLKVGAAQLSAVARRRAAGRSPARELSKRLWLSSMQPCKWP
jgi:hypothetical protein